MTLHPMPEAIREAFERCRDMDASLNERLEAFAQEIRQLNPAFQAAVDRFVARLRNADAGAAAPQVGDEMPRLPASRPRRSSCQPGGPA